MGLVDVEFDFNSYVLFLEGHAVYVLFGVGYIQLFAIPGWLLGIQPQDSCEKVGSVRNM